MRIGWQENFKRRTVLGAVAAAVTTAILAACGQSDSGVKGRVSAGSVDDVKRALTDQKYLRNDAGHFYLLPAAPDAVIAVSWRCTHQGCAVNAPDARSGQMKCPCHGALFDARTGTVIAGPASRPLDWMPVTIENGVVNVDTTKTATRRTFDASQVIQYP